MESINLNLIPQGANPVVHAKQFDEGRGFRFNLFNGTAPIVLTGAETITCNVKKPDGNLVTVAVTNTSSNYVEVYTTLQMCACYGANLGEIRLEEDGNDIGTLNFTLSVEESPLNNGIESESSIHNLNTMVDEMVAEEVATQYDSANVIFDNEPTDNHGIGYTVTSEGIKTAIGNAFDYDNTASGSLVHIEDGADNIPVKSLVSEIVAVETGNGQPKSPDNPYTISGFDSGIVPVIGKNWFDFEGWLNANSITYTKTGDSITFTPNSSLYTNPYVFSDRDINVSASVTNFTFNGTNLRLDFLNKNGVPQTSIATGSLVRNNFNACKVRLNWSAMGTSVTIDKPMINLGTTAETYEAYNGNTYTFTFGQTVYGGHFDNKGNLVVTYALTDINTAITSRTTSYANPVFYGSINGLKPQSNNSLCEAFNTINGQASASNFAQNSNNHDFAINNLNSGDTIQVFLRADEYTDVASLKSAVGNSKIKYELATPITLAITSQDIPTLLGENNIFSNCGDLEVNYYTYKSNDILEFVDSEIGKKNGTNIPIEANSQDSIKTYIDNEVSTINTSLSNKANKTEDTTITVASGYTLISSCCGKTDRLVHLNFNVEKSGGFAMGWQAIGTTDFKPNTLVYCPLWNVTNGLANGEVRIDTDGTINFYVVTAGELRLNANIGYITD